MAEWKKYTLQDLATIKYGKNQKDVVSQSGTIPIFGTGGLMGYATKPLYSEPSVLIGRKGTIEKVHYVTEPFWTVDTLFYTIINKELVTPYFFYCLMQLVDLKKLNEGTTIPSLRTETLNRLTFNVPPLSTQKKIAEVLSCLDAKIELNRRINENLKQQAQAIFKEWFVDNAKPEWKVGKLCEIADIIMGQSPDGKSYNEEENGKIFFQGRAEFGDRFPTIRLYTTEPKRIAPQNSVLLSVRAPVGDINVALEECCIGRGLASITAKGDYQSFVLYTMKNAKTALDVYNGEGTIFGCVNKDALNNLDVIIPPMEEIMKFEEVAKPIDEKIKANTIESRLLVKIRDALLPKLMNGELEV